jgi:hypothetical protein
MRAIYARYRQAARRLKQGSLNEFWATTGYHRKYTIRLLNGPPPEGVRRARALGKDLDAAQKALEAAGIRVASSPTEIPALLREAGYRG